MVDDQDQPHIPGRIPIFEWNPGNVMACDFDDIDLTDDTNIESMEFPDQTSDIHYIIERHLTSLTNDNVNMGGANEEAGGTEPVPQAAMHPELVT